MSLYHLKNHLEKKYGKFFWETRFQQTSWKFHFLCVHESLWKSDSLIIVVGLQHKYSNICNNPNG